MIELGRYSLIAALVFALGAVWFIAFGFFGDRKDLIRYGYYAVYGFFLSTVIASAVLLQAFLEERLQLRVRGGELRLHAVRLLSHRRVLGRAGRSSRPGCSCSPSRRSSSS